MLAARYSHSQAGCQIAQNLFFIPSFLQASGAPIAADGGTVGGSVHDRICVFFACACGAEHVDIPVPRRGGLQGSRHGGCFRTFLPKKKSAKTGPHSGSVRTLVHPRRWLSWHRRSFKRASGRDDTGGMWMRLPSGR